jgi:hypothetical protein
VTVPSPEPSPAATPGDPVMHRIATASADLEGIGELPLIDAANRFDALHSELQSALADLDQN